MSERDYNELAFRAEAAKRSILPGLYEHYKSGNIYQFEKISFDKKTERTLVLYHDECAPGISWSTTLEEWTSKVEVDGEMVPRYAYLSGELGDLATSKNVILE